MDINSRNGFLLREWRVYPLRNMLDGPDGEQHIEPKVMQVLEYLARKSGDVVRREELLDELWDGRAIGDEPLTRCIAALRRALDDSPKDPTFIQTIPKTGYRLICPVSPLSTNNDGIVIDPGDATTLEESEVVSHRGKWILTLGLSLVIAISFGTHYRVEQLESDVADAVTVERATLARPATNSIAVLPFRDLSGNPDNASFVHGVHADIISRIANMSSMDTVISRSSVQRYKDTNKPMTVIGQELNVATLLDGDVQRIGDRVRVNVNLIDAETEGHLWANTYEQELSAENLFAIQSEISSQVAETLQLTLTLKDSEVIETRPTNSLEAYSQYILGQEAIAMRTASSIETGRAHFENAIALDADFALAYVGLADSLAMLSTYAGKPIEETRDPRQAAIDRALVLQPLSGEAYASLAFLKEHVGESESAREYFEKAIKLSPNYAMAYLWYGSFFKVNRDFESALKMARRAAELDPMAPVISQELAIILWNLRRADEAEAAVLRGVRQNPEYRNFYTLMSKMLQAYGRLAESLQWQDAAVGLDPSDALERNRRCYLHLELGNDKAAEQCYDTLAEEQLGKRAVERANIYWYRQEHDAAIDYLETLLERHTDRNPKDYLALAYVLRGEPAQARAIWEELSPEFYDDPSLFVKDSQITLATYIAYVLFIEGETERANYLFDQVLERLSDMDRILHRRYRYSDILIHAVRGENQKAIDALRDAIDSGWRRDWWDLRHSAFDAMREIPEWNELVAELEADIVRQRLWYETHRGDPLF